MVSTASVNDDEVSPSIGHMQSKYIELTGKLTELSDCVSSIPAWFETPFHTPHTHYFCSQPLPTAYLFRHCSLDIHERALQQCFSASGCSLARATVGWGAETETRYGEEFQSLETCLSAPQSPLDLRSVTRGPLAAALGRHIQYESTDLGSAIWNGEVQPIAAAKVI